MVLDTVSTRRGFFGRVGALAGGGAAASAQGLTKSFLSQTGVPSASAIGIRPSRIGGTSDIFSTLLASGKQLPAWRMEAVEQEAKSRAEAFIEADVLSLRSVSLSARVQIQKRRNIEAQLHHIRNRSAVEAARKAFYERLGLDDDCWW